MNLGHLLAGVVIIDRAQWKYSIEKNEEIQLDFFGYLAGESIRFRRFLNKIKNKIIPEKISWILLAICRMEWSSKGFVGFHRAPNYPPCLPDHNGDDHGKKEQNVMMRKNSEGRWKNPFSGKFYWTQESYAAPNQIIFCYNT